MKKKTCLVLPQMSYLQLEGVGLLAPPGKEPQVPGSSHTPSPPSISTLSKEHNAITFYSGGRFCIPQLRLER